MGDPTYSGPLGRTSSLVHDMGDGGARAASAVALPYCGAELAATLLAKVFQRLPGPIALRLWSGPAFKVGAGAATAAGTQAIAAAPRFVLSSRNPQAVCALVLGRDP